MLISLRSHILHAREIPSNNQLMRTCLEIPDSRMWKSVFTISTEALEVTLLLLYPSPHSVTHLQKMKKGKVIRALMTVSQVYRAT